MNKKIFVIIVIIVAVMIVLAVMGIFYLIAGRPISPVETNDEKPADKQEVDPGPESDIEPALPVEEEEIQWGSYINETIGYRIKYPLFFKGRALLVEEKRIIIENEQGLDYVRIDVPFLVPEIYQVEGVEISIFSPEDWMTAMRHPSPDGHRQVDNCYVKEVAGYHGAVCLGRAIDPLYGYDRYLYFLMTPAGNLQAETWIINRALTEPEYEIRAAEIAEIIHLSDKIIDTFELITI